MKKFFYTIIVFFLSLGLVACKPAIAEDLTVSIVAETVIANHIEVHIVVPIELDSLEDLTEIMMNTASQTYEKHFDEIGTNKYSMTLILYQSTSDFDNNIASYGQAEFVINNSLTEPGLSIITTDLTIE